jgi:phenylalanyl-tRNA synthetase alpha chain
VPNLTELERKFLERFRSVSSLEDLESIRREYLGKKGILDSFLKEIPGLSLPERQKSGKDLNELKKKIQGRIAEKNSEFEAKNFERGSKTENWDHTLPSCPFRLGKSHPLTQVLNEITDIFLGMGFGIAEGPEIETDENNFGALNIPEDHPARDMHDTFYIKGGLVTASSAGKHSSQSTVQNHATDNGPSSNDRLLLRTHTSPVQIRQMLSRIPPIRVISPGKVYRHEAIDATHSSVFHQVEGLVVDRSVSFADLKGTLEIFCRRFFGEEVRTRFRPSYFPFVEPGAEMDISCALCDAKGSSKNRSICSVCKGTGWLEMLGAGMVHPNVFKAVGYDAESLSGFAFGMGIERIAMVRHGINDMRLFYENHLDFLSQF